MKKSVVVTGSSTGFGKLTVQTLAKDGHQVFATMRGVAGKNKAFADELTQWGKDHQLSVEVVELDVTSDESVINAAAHINAKVGAVDVVVNNAGIYGGGLDESYSVQDYKNIFEVNVFGVLRVVRAFLPAMRAKSTGLFVQISSVMGRIVIPFAGAYTSSKWAIEAVAESLRYELAPQGIDSVIVQPGAFPTEIFWLKDSSPSKSQSLKKWCQIGLLKTPESVRKLSLFERHTLHFTVLCLKVKMQAKP
jgi:NAD(P)-dependent dehydrogenase (short-subunit alcohol dehydrogenase family)